MYYQVMDVVQTLDGGGRRNMYDPDELEDEQRERDRRNKINGEFQQFVKRVQVRNSLAEYWSVCQMNVEVHGTCSIVVIEGQIVVFGYRKCGARTVRISVWSGTFRSGNLASAVFRTGA